MTVVPVSPAFPAAAIRPEAAPVPVSASVENVAPAGSTQSGTTQLTPTPETAPVNASPQMLALATLDAPALKAAAQAALGEGGLALLMADLSQALRIPGVPGSVQVAINQILALRAPLDTPPTGADIKTALIQSNPSPASLSLSEAALATNSPELPVSPLKGALLELQQVLKNWVTSAPAQLPSQPPSVSTSVAASQQLPAQPGSALPSVAYLSQALQASGLPAPIQSALLQLLGSTPSSVTEVPVPGAASLPGQSGPSAEATSPAAVPPAEGNALPANLKLAMPAIEQALNALLDAAPTEILIPTEGALAPPAAAPQAADPRLALQSGIEMASPFAPSSPRSQSANAPMPTESEAPVTTTTAIAARTAAQSFFSAMPASIDPKEVMAIIQQVFEAWFEAAPAKQAAASAAGSTPDAASLATSPGNSSISGKSPPPPYRGGPTTPQPSVPSMLPSNADSATVANRLLRETSAALAHQELLQIASTSPGTQGSPRADGQNQQWMFEIPFATPQGSAVAQFKVSRDGARRGKGGQAPAWRAQFSLDVEPMGPVHAQIVLAGDRTWVSLWAEREDSVARLREHEALLSTALKDSNFVAEIAFHAGAPRQPVTTAGYFLDHAS